MENNKSKCIIRNAVLGAIPLGKNGEKGSAKGVQFIVSRVDAQGVPEEYEHSVNILAPKPGATDNKGEPLPQLPDTLKALGWIGDAPVNGVLKSLVGAYAMVTFTQSERGTWFAKYINPMPRKREVIAAPLSTADMLELLTPKGHSEPISRFNNNPDSGNDGDAGPDLDDNDGIPF